MKLSRREAAAAMAGTALAVQVPAQPPPAAANSATAQAVREANRRNSELLAKFEVPATTEPAFQFKA